MKTNGLNHIADTFSQAHARGRAALMPYFTLGFPDPQQSLSVIEAIACSGADLIELGIPFSDPLADGPTIQHSTQVALEQGASLGRCLAWVSQLRQRGVRQPLLMMGYTNPILAFGLQRFVEEADRAGADGFIIPDLPPEEAGEMEAACRDHQLALVFLAAPTSTPERLALIGAHSTGFLYLVSLTGVTGARRELSPDLADFVERARGAASIPLAIGFGVSTPAQASSIGRLADGVIIGSALIDAVSRTDDPAPAAAAFVTQMANALAEHAKR
jgi:tryptophan synthase alpha chain